ncbi:MAG: holo-ACP synthase [Gaiellales bacterium]|nr:holo-ACP synthase [Gaiellales bacterium]
MKGGLHPLAGIDAVEVERFRAALRNQPRLESRLFTEREAAPFRGKRGSVQHLAARFAAKEAVGKLLGCGVTAWKEIEVLSDGGAPYVRLHGRAWHRATELGIGEVVISLTHTATIAAACAVALAGAAIDET